MSGDHDGLATHALRVCVYMLQMHIQIVCVHVRVWERAVAYLCVWACVLACESSTMCDFMRAIRAESLLPAARRSAGAGARLADGRNQSRRPRA